MKRLVLAVVFLAMLSSWLPAATMSEFVRMDCRRTLSGRLATGTEMISLVAEGMGAGAVMTIDGRAIDGWSASNPYWDTRTVVDGWHDLVLDDGERTEVRSLLVLNGSGVQIHEGDLSANETWVSGRVHIVRNWVRVPEGVKLTIAKNAVVKFCDDTGIIVDGALDAGNAVFTHLADDAEGGDTDKNGETIVPYDEYSIVGDGTINVNGIQKRYVSMGEMSTPGSTALKWFQQSEYYCAGYRDLDAFDHDYDYDYDYHFDYDGIAWQSGRIGNQFRTYMETTVTGPGTLSFVWDADVEEGCGYLGYYVDGKMINNISGGWSWLFDAYEITTPGEHTVRWEFYKNGTYGEYEDWHENCGWVDCIHFERYDRLRSLDVSSGKGSGVYAVGESVAVSAVPPAGRVFVSWEAEGIQLSNAQKTSSKLTFDMPDGDVTLTAVTKKGGSTPEKPEWEYSLDGDGNAVITAYNGRAKNLVVPAKLDGHPVVAIASGAFGTNSAIVSVTLPVGIKFPGRSLFSGCTNLTAVNYTLDGVCTDFGQGVKVNVAGAPAAEATTTLLPGWNLIAIPQGELTSESRTALQSLGAIFSYDAGSRSFLKADTIEPGKAYWIFATKTLVIKTINN